MLFSAGSTLVAVCPACRSAVARRGVDLEAIGRVAELVPTGSAFRIGATGNPRKGLGPFRVVGRLQLSFGQGTWDEWHVAFEDGSYGWLSEAAGQLHLMLPLPAPSGGAVPEWEALGPGRRLELKPHGTFLVTDRRESTYVAADGELPFDAPPGSTFRYADLSGTDGSLATLDYGDDPGVDAFFVGKPVELAELGAQGLVPEEQRQEKARARSLNCPSCGAGLKLNDPRNVVRVACTYCGSLLSADAHEKFEVLDRLEKVPFVPLLPLGSRGTLDGKGLVVLGALVKSCVVEGVTYRWREYLLRDEKKEDYHWIAESNGHWMLLSPVPAGKVAAGDTAATFQGRTYKRFQRTNATVDAVLGEFTWTVSRGEKTAMTDYVSPPRMLSVEQSEEEIAWTEGRYVFPDELGKAFGLAPDRLPSPEGVGACQPWPGAAESKGLWKVLKLVATAATVILILSHVAAARKVVFDQTFVLPGSFGKGDEGVYVSNPITLDSGRNMKVEVFANTDNNWVGVEGAVIEEASGEARAFRLTSDRYHGVSGGESWSEGSQGRSTYLSRVPAGTYVVRVDCDFDTANPPPWVRVKLTSGVPSIWRFVLFLLFLATGPLVTGLAYASFEGRRWAESDAGGGGEDEGDDGGDDE